MEKLDEQLQSSIRRQDGDGDVNSARLSVRSSAIVGLPPRRGSTIVAIEWTETLAGEATSRRVRGTVWARAESTARAAWKGWRVRVSPQGVCGLHRQNEIHAGVDSIVSKNLADNGVAAPRDTRAAPPGSDTWTSADSPV